MMNMKCLMLSGIRLYNETCVSVDVPGRVDAKLGETIVIGCRIPHLRNGRQSLIFRSSQQDMEIYVDGKLRESYTTKDTRKFGKNSMSCNVLVDLNQADSNRELIVKMTTNTINYNGVLNDVYIGTTSGLFHMLVIKYMPALLLALALLFTSIIAFIISVYLRHKYHQIFGVEFAAMSGIIVSSQSIIESKLRQFYFPNMSMAGFVSYVLVAMIPICVIMFSNHIQEHKYKRSSEILIIICLLNLVIDVVLQILNIADLLQTMTISYVLFFVAFVHYFVCFIFDAKNHNIVKFKISALGVLLAYSIGLCEIISIISNYAKVYGVYLCAGMSVLLFASIWESLIQINEMNREKQRAIHANEAKSGFLANMSHEIRTPINGIIGMNEMVLRESQDPQILDYSRQIKSASKNLLRIVNEILDFSKIESGNMDLVCVEYSTAKLFYDCYQPIFNLAEEKGIKLSFQVDENIPSCFYGDDIRIRQIITNLLSNAVKYTKEGGVTLKAKAIHLEDKKYDFEIAVIDTGMGIKKKNIEDLFVSFKRIEEKRTRNIQGTGLGLNITKHLLDEIGGHIDVESEYEKGSKFVVVIPQSAIDETPMGDFMRNVVTADTNTEENNIEFEAPTAKVLIVDDVLLNIEVLKQLLKKSNIQIFSALSGKRAIELLKEVKFDLVFMDHMMPEMDGVETYHEYMNSGDKINSDTPMIILTANAIVGAKEKYYEEGFQDYLSKPVELNQLYNTLLHYIPDEKIIHKRNEALKISEIMEALTFLDTDASEVYWGGNQELYVSLLQEFCSENRIQAMQDAFNENNYKLYMVIVHSIKSTSLSIGAASLSKKAEAMENWCKKEEYDLVRLWNSDFIDQYKQLVDQIKQIVF